MCLGMEANENVNQFAVRVTKRLYPTDVFLKDKHLVCLFIYSFFSPPFSFLFHADVAVNPGQHGQWLFRSQEGQML